VKGTALDRAEDLLRANGYAEALRPAKRRLPQPADAAKAFRLCWATVLLSRRKQQAQTRERAEAFAARRPKSAFGYVQAANALEKPGDQRAADELYQKAMTADASALSPWVLRAQRLNERGEVIPALRVLQTAWTAGKNKAVLAIPMCNVLKKQGDHARCAKLLGEALERRPTNGYLWAYLAESRKELGDHKGAATAYARAFKLWPTKPELRAAQAQELEKAGDIDAAEKAYRALTADDRYTATWHFLLAQFLSKHRPEAKGEALKEAREALRLPDRGKPAKQAIQRLLLRLTDQGREE